MENIHYKNTENLNSFRPKKSREYKIKGKSGENRLNPESCPAVRSAAGMGLMFFSEKEYIFDGDDYTVYKYPTRCRSSGKEGFDIVTPNLLGSNENENGYFKIGNGLNIKLGSAGALILPPVDPRFRIKNIEYTIAALPPFYTGILIAGIKPLGYARIPEGHPIGQLVFLDDSAFELIEGGFEDPLRFTCNNYEIIGNPVVTSAKKFHSELG